MLWFMLVRGMEDEVAYKDFPWGNRGGLSIYKVYRV
jgi:hypothetical protein